MILKIKSVIFVYTAFLTIVISNNYTFSQDPSCKDCHPKENLLESYNNSIHDKKNVSCTDCHGRDKFDRTKSNPHLMTKDFKGILKPRDVPEACGSCHRIVLNYFTNSAHYLETIKSNMKGCIDCHNYHKTIEPTHEDIINFCVKCHSKGTTRYEQGLEIKRNLEQVMFQFSELHNRISYIKDAPGVDLETELSTLNNIQYLLDGLHKFQHTMKYGELYKLFYDISTNFKNVSNNIEQSESNIHSRKWWLMGFIALILINIILVIIKFSKVKNDSE